MYPISLSHYNSADNTDSQKSCCPASYTQLGIAKAIGCHIASSAMNHHSCMPESSTFSSSMSTPSLIASASLFYSPFCATSCSSTFDQAQRLDSKVDTQHISACSSKYASHCAFCSYLSYDSSQASALFHSGYSQGLKDEKNIMTTGQHNYVSKLQNGFLRVPRNTDYDNFLRELLYEGQEFNWAFRIAEILGKMNKVIDINSYFLDSILKSSCLIISRMRLLQNCITAIPPHIRNKITEIVGLLVKRVTELCCSFCIRYSKQFLNQKIKHKLSRSADEIYSCTHNGTNLNYGMNDHQCECNGEILDETFDYCDSLNLYDNEIASAEKQEANIWKKESCYNHIYTKRNPNINECLGHRFNSIVSVTRWPPMLWKFEKSKGFWLKNILNKLNKWIVLLLAVLTLWRTILILRQRLHDRKRMLLWGKIMASNI